LQGNGNIYFDDPINCGTGGKNSLVKSGTGTVQFCGNSVLNPSGKDGGSVEIKSGEFRVVQGASFTTLGNDATFTTGANTTLAGGGTITADKNFTISGTISPDSFCYANNFDTTKTTTGNNIGTLTLVGDVNFSNTTLAIDLGTGNTSDKIAIDGTVTVNNNVTVILQSWATGTFTLLTATSGGVSLSDYTLDSSSLSVRKHAVLSATANALTLETTSDNLNLRWTGGNNGNWNTTATGNWVVDSTTTAEMFAEDDYVTFTNTGANQNITVGTGVQVDSGNVIRQ
jgi:hypothetical protein